MCALLWSESSAEISPQTEPDLLIYSLRLSQVHVHGKMRLCGDALKSNPLHMDSEYQKA